MATREILLLIDGHSLAFRAFHALPSTLTTASGEPGNVVYGFLSVLFRLIEAHRPGYVAVTFDLGAPFRVKRYDQYKAGRLEPDPEVERQVAQLRRVLEAFEMPVFEVEAYEADDILKTLAGQAEGAGLKTLIFSGDRDLFQVVSAQTTVLYPTRAGNDPEVYDPARVQQRFGVRPDQFCDYKALVGDASDNVPGVRGVGEKGAATLLQTYGTLDGIFANLDQITPARTRTALQAADARPRADLARELVTLVEVPGVQLDLETCRLAYDRGRSEAALTELGFKTLVKRLP
jgi:DNA polymerase-1